MSLPNEPQLGGSGTGGGPTGVQQRESAQAPWLMGWRCWIQTTSGIVLMLLSLQFFTGLLLAFYYVPATDHAYTTVTYVEKALPAGSWIRALHHYGSQWLPFFLLLHIWQLFWRGTYRTKTLSWAGAVVLLGLVMAAGATGYSLPWDARAFFSTRVAEGLVGGLPLLGNVARIWLLGGDEISTLTLSRFFALHVFLTPLLFLFVVAGGLWLYRGSESEASAARAFITPQLFRNSLISGGAFLLLALYARKFPAPLGPAAATITTDYVPRPGAQFLWLYQLLKYLPGGPGSLFGVVLPGIVLLLLVLLPWLNWPLLRRLTSRPRRHLGAAILSLSSLVVGGLTLASYLSDRRDPRTRQQLLRQTEAEAQFRRMPFVPGLLQAESEDAADSHTASIATAAALEPPAAYRKLCATCHGQHGEGARQGPLRFPQLVGVSTKPRRTIADIVALLNDPKAYGLEPPMKSFATKLSDEEKRQIAEWLVTLK